MYVSAPAALAIQEILETSTIQYIRNALKCAHHGKRTGILTRTAMEEALLFQQNIVHVEPNFKKNYLSSQIVKMNNTFNKLSTLWNVLDTQMKLLAAVVEEEQADLSEEKERHFRKLEAEKKAITQEIEEINRVLKNEVQEERKLLDKKQEYFDHMTKKIDTFHTGNKVVLDIGLLIYVYVILTLKGGTRYTTSLESLQKIKGSFFAEMFSGSRPLKPESDGSYFIDR